MAMSSPTAAQIVPGPASRDLRLAEGEPAETSEPLAGEIIPAGERPVVKPQASEVDKAPEASKPPPAFMYLMAMCAALNSTNIGFDIGVGSGVQMILQELWGLSDGQIGLFMGSIHITAALGGLCSQAVADRLGRRLTFVAAQGLVLTGLILTATSTGFVTLMFGRIFVGFAVGLGLAIDALYIAELAPAAHRGRLTSWPEIAINFGILLGFSANWCFAGLPKEVSWRLMVACGAVLPLCLLALALTVMPESPRWLATRGRLEKAASVLQRTHAKGHDIIKVVDAMREEIRQDESSARLGWAPLLRPDPATRRMLMIGVGVAFAQQINGSESVVAFSPTIFQRGHVATTKSALFAVTMLVGLCKTVFICVAAHLVDRVGRRPLLLVSTGTMTLCLAALSVAMALDISWLSVVAVCSFVAAFSIGIGPITWLLAAEVFPSQVRAKAMSMATCVNRLTSGLVCLTFLPLSDALGGQAPYFALFTVLTGMTVAGIWLVVPETKCLTLEQMSKITGGAAKEQEP